MIVPPADHQISLMKYVADWLRIFNDRRRLALATVVLLHLVLVIPLAALLNLWIDEAYTLETTGGGFMHAIQRSLGFELQPPLYFVSLTFWRVLNDSAFFARLFSILCTALTVLVSRGLARRYLPGVPSILVAAVVAFSPLTVFAAIEARYYAMALLLSALLLRFFHDGYVAAQPSAAARRWYTVTAIAALYTYYFLGFFLAAGGAALLLMRRSEALRKYLLDMAVTAILFAPLTIATWRQMSSVHATTDVTGAKTIAEGATLVWQTAWRQLLPVNQYNLLTVVRSWVSRLAVPVLLLGALAHRRWPTSITLVPLALAATVSFFFIWIAMYLGPDFVKPQHTTTLYLPVLLSALALLQYAVGVRAASLATLVSLVFAIPYLLENYAPLAKQGDWIRVSRYIEQHEHKSEPILVFKAEFVLDFGYHYAGLNPLIPLPKPTSRERYDLTEQVLHEKDEIVHALSGRLGETRRFWLITSHTVPFRGIDPHPEILEIFVLQHCRVLRDKSFWKSRVRLLELRPEVVIGGGTVDSAKDGRNEPGDNGLQR